MSKEKFTSPFFKFRTECYGPDGRLKWHENFRNLVTTTAKNLVMNTLFQAGTAPSAWFLGVKGTGNPAAGDQMSSHAGWAETTNYTGANRIQLSLSTAVGGTSTFVPGTFAMNANYTVAGAFVTTGTVVGGTVGTLYSAGDIATTRTGGTGDTIIITPTLVLS